MIKFITLDANKSDFKIFRKASYFTSFLQLVFAMPLCASVYMCLVVTCLERADLWCLTVSVSLSHWYPESGVVLD